MALTEEQIATFWRDGFLPVPDVLTPDEVAALRKRTEHRQADAAGGLSDLKSYP